MKRFCIITLLLGMIFQVNAQLTLNSTPETVVEIDDRNSSNDFYYWDVDIHAYPNTMSVTSIIMINGEEQFNTDLEVGAFCNGECRGRQRPRDTYYSVTNHYLMFLTTYGNNGDQLEFRLYDHGIGQEVDVTGLTTLTFSTGNSQGSPGVPFEIAFYLFIPTYTINVSASPAAGGEVFGAGDYEEGSSCTLTAVANNGYIFTNWTKDGEVVSTEANYIFTVTEEASYVANFDRLTQLTVNDGTNTNGYVPIYGYWCDQFSKSQFILPAEILPDMLYGTITKMTFYSSDANVSWGNAQFEVYLTEVDYTSFSSTSSLVDWNTMDKVRNEGILSIVNNQMVVEFDNGYQYGGGNLLIGIRETVSGSFVSCNWYGVSSLNNAIGGYENSRSLSLFSFQPKTTFDFIPSDNYCPRPTDLTATDLTATTVTMTWTESEGATEWDLRYKASGANQYTGLEYGFENGMGDWTAIDADGDGHTWGPASVLMGGYNGHSGIDMMCSQSYIINVGALYPDNYLVSPLIQLGGSISFWACGQDNTNYAEHFGVAVSTSGNTNASNFTTIQEWTIGSTLWHQYTVDLSDYSGMGYVAIRHFNCSGLSYLNVDDVVISEQPEWTMVEGLNQTNYTLADLEPTSTYEVQVRSICGNDNMSAWTVSNTFTTDPTCFPVNILSYSEVDALYAILSWTLIDEGQTAWDVQYATNSSFTQGVQLIANVDIHENYMLEGLNPQTTYYVRVRGNCGNDDTSEWSNAISFTTPIACNVPTNLAISNVSNLSVVASWTAGSEGQNVWDIQYKASDAEEWIMVQGLTETTYTINGLEPATNYMVQVRANCGGAYGVSEWTNSVSFITNFCPLEDQCIINYTLYDGYGDGWTGNTIRVVDVETNIIFANLTLQSGSSTSGSIGLCPDRTYNFIWVNGSWVEECSFVLTDANGNEILSGNHLDLPFDFVNCAISCKRPKNLTVTTIEAFSAVLTWTSGEVWDVAYKLSEEQEFTIIDSVENNPYTLAGLIADATYIVKVRGNCGESVSEWSNEYTFTTAIACNVPTNLTVSEISDHSVVATWTAGHGDQSEWELQYKPVDEEEWTLVEGLTETTYTISGMESGTIYEVQVRANCGGEYGVSSWTNSVNFVTNFCPLENQCIINYSLQDSWGDGWNGNAIQVVDVESNLTFATLTIPSGSSASGSIGLCPDRTYNFIWINGNYINECSFVLTDADGNEILSGNHLDLPFDFANCDITCKKPKNLTTTMVGAHTAVLTWTSGEAWDVAYKAYGAEDFTIIENVMNNTYTLDNLNPETTYIVKVRTNCGESVSYWSNELSFTTQESCPTPTNLNVNLSYEQAVITWSSVGNAWDLQYRPAGQSTWTTVEGLTEPTYTINGLGSATTYYVRVRAICDDSSDWSSILSFTSYVLYNFYTYVDEDVYPMNTLIPIHGNVISNVYGTPVAGLDVEIGITVMGWKRTLTATTNENGEFYATFEPLPMESGYYTVNSGTIGNSSTAVHDSFDILAMNVMEITLNEGLQVVNSQWLLCNVVQDIPQTGHILIRNRNSFNLTNIQVSVLSAPAGTEFSFVPMAVTSMSEAYLEFTALGTLLTPSYDYQEVRLKATCDQGTEAIFTLWFYCEEAQSILDISPLSINTTMTRGASKTLDVTVSNNGQAATGEITVSLPNVDWMSVVGTTTLPSIDVNESASFTLRLSPDNSVALAQYTGSIAVSCEHGESVYLPYTIEAVSDSIGGLLVDVTDEFTTNTNGGNGPHLEGAEVTLIGYYDLQIAAHGYTDADGLFSVDSLREGYYVLRVQADMHSKVERNIMIVAGNTNQQDVFLQYQCVSYSWMVEPTEIPDEYTIVLNLEYEVEVPVPVVTVSTPSCVWVEDEAYTFNYVVTNHGLIDAYNLALHTPESDYYLFTPLFDYIDTIHAHQTIEIPCVVTLKTGVNSDNPEWGQTRVNYSYLSGENMMYNQAIGYTRLGSCQVVYTYGETLPSLGGGGAPSIGGGGSGGGGGYVGVETPVVENQIPSVNVKVGVQFSQRLTMTREAFIGTFAVNNGHDTNALQGIGLDFVVKNGEGVDCTDLFQISTVSMDGVTGIDGDGTLAAGADGLVKILFIPTKEAAPIEPVTYAFGGTFTFVDPWNSVTRVMELYPAELEVHPSPDLYIDYFVASDVYGDNPLTAEIEDIVPAEIAVRIWNKGAGTAKNVILESAEPVIVSNIQGLLIDFDLYGAYIDGVGAMPGLNSIEFGNIESGETKVGEWLFTSTLQAHLVSYDAHVIHNNSYGNPNLSLVSHVGIHRLTHPIHTFGARANGINDFLVDDIPDENNYPDSIFFSDGGRTSVGVVESIEFDHFVTSHDTIVTLTVNPSRIGWNYGETEDPGRNRYELVSCTRNNDGQVIPLSNIWQESVLIHTGDYAIDSVYEDKLRIVDTVSVIQTVTYTLVFNGIPSDPYIFTGDEDQYWSSANNWEEGIKPNKPTSNVLIDGICLLNEDATVSNLTISEGKSLTIPEDRIMTVTKTLTNTLTTGLVIEDGGQLMHANEGAQATVKKDVVAYANDNDGWYLIASPLVANTAVTEVSNMLSNDYDLYYYDEPTYYWMNQEFEENNFTQLENGRGYLYANNEAVTLEFAGELQNGSAMVNVPLSYTANIPLSGFNLVGNPFAHNVTAYTSVNVAEGCYQTNETMDDLMVGEISEENPVKPTEGFFVKASSEGASITFNQSRAAKEINKGSIRVELAYDGKLLDRLIVKKDGEPLEKLSLKENRTKLYATQGHQEMSIVPCKGNEQLVNFKAAKNGSYTIIVNTKEMEFIYLFLVDNLTGEWTDLLETSSYTFEAKTTDYASRFRLVFGIGEEDSSNGSNTFAFYDGSEWVILNSGRATLQVVDALGHVLRNEVVDGNTRVSTNHLSAGVYIIRLLNGENIRTQKIVVR